MNTFKLIVLILLGGLTSTPINAQSFLKKALKTIDKVNNALEATTSSTQQSQKESQKEEEKETVVSSNDRPKKDNGKTTAEGLHIGSIATDWATPIIPRKTAQTKVINIDSRSITCSQYFKDNACFVCDPTTKLWGAFDTTGTQIIKYEHDFGLIHGKSQNPEFENGVCPVRNPKGSYIIDKTGKKIKQFTDIRELSNFRNGIATALQSYPDPKNKYRTISRVVYINNKGEIIFPHLFFELKWNDVEPMRQFSDNLAAYFDYNLNKWGFINQKGEIIVKAQYTKVQDFHDGYAAVQNENKKWGYIDTTGVVKIDYKFANEPFPFSEGVAFVSRREGTNCLIDKNGTIILDQVEHISPFYQGRAFVDFNYQSPYKKYDQQNRYKIIIDKDLKVVGLATYLPTFEDVDHNFHWPQDGLWYYGDALVDTKGDEIFCAKSLHEFSDNRAFCYIDDGSSYLISCFINREGEIVFMFKEYEF